MSFYSSYLKYQSGPFRPRYHDFVIWHPETSMHQKMKANIKKNSTFLIPICYVSVDQYYNVTLLQASNMVDQVPTAVILSS